MAPVTDEPAPNGTAGDLGRLKELLEQLTTNQKKFIARRLDFSTDKEAAEAIGMSADTVKGWKYAGDPIDEAVRLMANDGVIMSCHLRRRALARAMLVKTEGLDSRDERVRQAVATEIIEWELGKATQKQEVAGTVTLISDGDSGPFAD
jgi:hypothetical protein